MKLSEFVSTIFNSGDLESKLIEPSSIEFDDFTLWSLPSPPKRNTKIAFSENQSRFPKAGSLSQDNKKAQALNSFANHELLAIEMMACALAMFPHNTEEEKRAKRGLIKALKDEQLHFSLYNNRLNEYGYTFGDFTVNDFFWKQMKNIKSLPQFFAVMSLTFEAANLDFAFHYEKIFKNLGDFKTAAILQKVYEDEISHVALGHHYLDVWKGDKSIWEYYKSILPFPITPKRSFGINFHKQSRVDAGLSEEFIENARSYDDNFGVTKRKPKGIV
jgi:uncharacterized ferritin-like protein (DUF455 family)